MLNGKKPKMTLWALRVFILYEVKEALDGKSKRE